MSWRVIVFAEHPVSLGWAGYLT